MKSERGQIAQAFVILVLVFIAFVMLAALLGGPGQQSAVSSAMSNIAAELDYNNNANNNAVLFSASPHALQHAEATSIQDCLNKNGPAQVWKDRSTGDFYALCEIKKGTWGLAVCTASGYNKTMFSPGDASWNDTWKYVFSRGTRFIKGLPAGCD